MKHFLFLIVFATIFISSGRSQVKINILDSFSRQPLSYATVYQFSCKSLLLCTSNGETELQNFVADTIRVSRAGYVDKIIAIDRNSGLEFKLLPDIKILPEIVVQPCIQWSKALTYKPQEDSATFGGFMWGNMADKGRIAMFLPGKDEQRRLSAFTLYLKPGMRGNKQAAKAPVRFSFYSVDTVTMLPSDLLSSKAVLFRPRKLGSQEIQVDSLGLLIPIEGFYIAVEGYQDDVYSYLVPIKMPDGAVDTVKMYGGAFEGLYSKDTWLSFYNFKSGQWTFGAGKPFDKTKRHGAIRYQMKYIVCKD